MQDYIDILKEWQQNVLFPLVFDHLDELLPSYRFRRLRNRGRDYWASAQKIDGSAPKTPNREKTVVYRDDMNLREQGDWNSPVSVVDAICRHEGLSSMYEFNVYVSGRYGLEMPNTGGSAGTRTVSRSQVQRKVLDALQDYFRWNLKNNSSRRADQVRSYLADQRGFPLEEALSAGFGFVPSWERVTKFITEHKGIAKEDLDSACGVGAGVGETHVLSIPYVCGGVLKGFLFRCVERRVSPRYMANSGLDRKNVFFGIPSRTESLLVVEGEMDALKCRQAGFGNAVAIGGSEVSGERRRQMEDAFRRGVKAVTLCLDLDRTKDGTADTDSHYRHIMKSVHTIRDIEPFFEDIRVVCFDEPCDPDECIRKSGADAFIKAVADAKPYWEYLYEYHKKQQKGACR